MKCYSSHDQAKAPLNIEHDFGSGYSSDEFKPATLRGYTEPNQDGTTHEIPLVWGQEVAKLLSKPLQEVGEDGVDVVFAISGDQSRVAVSNSEKVVIFDGRSQEELFHLQHEDNVGELEFSSNTKFLLASTGSRTTKRYSRDIKVWNLELEAQRHHKSQELKSKADTKKMLEEMLSTARTYLIDSTQDWSEEQFKSQAEGELKDHLTPILDRIERRHESAKGKGFQLEDVHLSSFGSKAWHPSESRFLFLKDLKKQPPGVNGTIADLIVWDAISQKEVLSLKGHEGPIMWSGFSPDGEWIASSSWDSKVRVWNSSNGELKHVLSEEGINQSWTGRFSPDSKLLAVGNGDGWLRIWDVKSGVLKFKLELKREGKEAKHCSGWIRGIEWVSETLIWISGDVGIASLFNLSSTDPTSPLSAQKLQNFVQGKDEFFRGWEIQSIKASEDGNRVGFKLGNEEMVVYDIKKNERWSVVSTLNLEERNAGFSEMEFANDKGTEVWAGGNDGALRLWKLE